MCVARKLRLLQNRHTCTQYITHVGSWQAPFWTSRLYAGSSPGPQWPDLPRWVSVSAVYGGACFCNDLFIGLAQIHLISVSMLGAVSAFTGMVACTAKFDSSQEWQIDSEESVEIWSELIRAFRSRHSNFIPHVQLNWRGTNPSNWMVHSNSHSEYWCGCWKGAKAHTLMRIHWPRKAVWVIGIQRGFLETRRMQKNASRYTLHNAQLKNT